MNKKRQHIYTMIIGTCLGICALNSYASVNDQYPCNDQKNKVNQVIQQFSDITLKDNNYTKQLSNQLNNAINLYQNCLQHIALSGHNMINNTRQNNAQYNLDTLQQTTPSHYEQPKSGDFLKKADTLQPSVKQKNPANNIKWFN